MIDFHSHVLPKLDDGSRSTKESVEMMRRAVSQGITAMVATPHFYADRETPKEFLKRREESWKRLREAGYLPYYLYRQKYMSGALENIGWCKPGCEGIYNICIMAELHTILALGGGGSTKLTDPATGKIVRITNPKYPHVYLERVEQVCQNKAELVPFHLALRRRAEETT